MRFTDRDENVSLVCLCAVVFKPGGQFAAQVIRLSAEDGLYLMADNNHADSPQFLQAVAVDQPQTVNLDPQAGDAGIQTDDILFATKGGYQLLQVFFV